MIDVKDTELKNFRKYANEIVDPEINKHDRMKMLGRKILFYMGIPSKNIFEEVRTYCDGKTYIIDLIGYPSHNNCYDNRITNHDPHDYVHRDSDDFCIAIECGDNKAEKIEAMRRKFPLVLILPYKEFDYESSDEVKVIRKITKNLEQQSIENYYYVQNIRSLQTEFEKIRSSYNNEVKNYKESVKADAENAIDELRKDLEDRMKDLDYQIQQYEEDIYYLREFKEFCNRYANKR